MPLVRVEARHATSVNVCTRSEPSPLSRYQWGPHFPLPHLDSSSKLYFVLIPNSSSANARSSTWLSLASSCDCFLDRFLPIASHSRLQPTPRFFVSRSALTNLLLFRASHPDGPSTSTSTLLPSPGTLLVVPLLPLCDWAT